MGAGIEHDLVELVRDRIWRECDAAGILAAGDDHAASAIRALACQFLREERRVLSRQQAADVVEQVVDATLGLGPLQPLLADPMVSEVMVNGHDHVYVEREGQILPTDARFADEDHLRQVIDRMLAPIGRRVDSMSPMVDARLPDGSRVNAIVPPLAVDGSALTIRRFLDVARTLDDLERLGACDRAGRTVLERLVEERRNVIVAGATSSGKTTLLAAAIASCGTADRIVVIEDAAELPIANRHRVRLEARPALFEPGREVTVRSLVRNALRMRPDRIILGEVRGDEAFDLVQALNTGHRGCWSTVHANGVEDALLRVETMALASGVAVPQPVMRGQVARAVDAVVFMERGADGVRRISSIVEVEEDGGCWQLVPLSTG